MENTERELIQRALDSNFEVRKLYDQHREYEQRLKKLSRQVYLTPAEEVEQRRLKQLKLHGVERMIRLATTTAGEGQAAA